MSVLHEPRVVVKQIVADDVQAELRGSRPASRRCATRSTTDRARRRAMGGEHRDVLETYRMFAHDRGWLRRLREAVMTGLTAEAAVERVQNDARAKCCAPDRPLSARAAARSRRSRQPAAASAHRRAPTPTAPALPENAILVARMMGPAALLEYDRTRLRGLVLEDGGPSSHVAIIARALGIPCVGEVANITDIVEPGDALIVDGGAGEVQVRPPPDVEAAYAEKARLRARRQEQYRRLRDRPAVTADGVPIGLHMNAGLLIDMPHIERPARLASACSAPNCNS
jgi:phosphotransferase system enzyme I (PtsP)